MEHACRPSLDCRHWFAVLGLCLAHAGAAVARTGIDLGIDRPTTGPATLIDRHSVNLGGWIVAGSGPVVVTVTSRDGVRKPAPLDAQPAHTPTRWHLGNVFLQPGRNTFQVRAVDNAGHTAVRYLAITRVDKAASPATPTMGTVWQGGRKLGYRVVHGRALLEGDIDLGDAQRLGDKARGPDNRGVGVPGTASLWPWVGGVAQVPYTVVSGNSFIPSALTRFNAVFAGVIQWVPRTAEADYVSFNLNPNDHSGAGEAALGRVGGQQFIGGSIDVSLGTLLHEMGHAVGLYHEHSRPDRDAFVAVHAENIIKSLADNFNVLDGNAQATGLYDLASIMQYPAYTFSKNGEPTLETIPPGMPLGELGDYSAGDIDSVLRLYQRAPSAVTVTSNPPGLQVVVDGVTLTTPQTLSLALDSVHTLDVPAAPQTRDGVSYVYGRWSDNRLRAHSFTVGRGSGLTGSPSGSPAVTVYSANFVELVPFAPWVYPAGAGSLMATPAALTYPPLAGAYYVKRQAVQLQANPTAGQQLYRLYTADGPTGQNPKTTRSPDWVLAYFSNQALTTVAASSPGRWVWIDGDFWETPVNWAADYDSGWTPGSTHHLDVAISPQLPYSWSIRYPWTAWSDGGAQAHDMTLPAGSSTNTANFGTEFNAWAWATQPCAGSVALSPTSADGFYPTGTLVGVSQTPLGAWRFTGWQRDLSGAASPASLTMDDEHVVVADYNTAKLPITVASLAPASVAAGQAGMSLKIKGQGFTSASRVWVNGVFRLPSTATSTQLTVDVLASEIAQPGAVSILVDNLPAGAWSCSAYALRTLFVRNGSAQPQAQMSPASLKFAKQPVGTTSAPQLVIVTNPGNRLLALDDLLLVGPQSADFVLGASTCSSGLAASGTCTVEVAFKPIAKGKRAASLWLLDSAFDSPQAIALSGTAKP